jgi:hypothetical protein
MTFFMWELKLFPYFDFFSIALRGQPTQQQCHLIFCNYSNSLPLADEMSDSHPGLLTDSLVRYI